MNSKNAAATSDPFAWTKRSHLDALHGFARAGALVIILTAACVLVGWRFDIDILKSVLPAWATMKVNTACGLLATGCALWLLHTQPGAKARLLARALGVFVAALGAITLSEDVFNIDLGLDQLLAQDGGITDTLHPGRMASVTAVSFFFIGAALFTLQSGSAALRNWTNWLAAPALFVSALAIVGYFYGVVSLYSLRPFSSMAAHTAMAFFIASASIMAANPTRGVGKLLLSGTAGGMVARRLLPTLPFALLALGWVSLQGERAGLYRDEFAVALIVLLAIAVCGFAILSTGATLHRVDVARRRREAEIVDLNEGLERRVEERTHELEQLSDELKAANDALEELSLHDALTGLANRRFFDAYLGGQIALARRSQQTLALVLIDVDSFKLYNDQYGHLVGDECLKSVAAALRSCCRRPADMAARYGGEEFALILPDTDLVGAARIAEAARAAVAHLKIPHAAIGSIVSVSGGVAVSVRNVDCNAAQLVVAADKRLYMAKNAGRNRMISAHAEAA